MFADYTHIICPVYSLNIDTIKGNPDSSPGDGRVGLTIAEVVNGFFSKVGNVAIYVTAWMSGNFQERENSIYGFTPTIMGRS